MRRDEIVAVLTRAADALAAGEATALAVVVGVTGSAYRRTGAAMAVGHDWTTGTVSAGCLESDVVLRARSALERGAPETVEYDTGDRSPFGLGVGCGGRVRIALVPLGPETAPHVRRWAAGAAADGPFAWDLALGGGLSFRRIFPAPDHLHLYGAGADSPPIAELAGRSGFRVSVIDPRPALLRAPRFEGVHARIQARPGEPTGAPTRDGRIFAVIKTHHLEHDRAWLRVLRASDALYIGLMGPVARVGELIADTGGPDPRIRAPVGLDLGGEGPEAVALSIVAELVAVANGRTATSLAARQRSA